MTRHEFTLPKSFQAVDCLPLRLATRADDANWLVSHIGEGQHMNMLLATAREYSNPFGWCVSSWRSTGNPSE